MNGPITIHPGWPLTVRDYDPLLAEMRRQLPDLGKVTVAHSRGALDALASPGSDGPLILLAPSDPRRQRPGDRIARPALRFAGRVPLLAPALAERLRRRSFAAFGMAARPGEPLSLVEVADRLRHFPASKGNTPVALVITSPEDRRHAEQRELARELGAPVLLVGGGHMFPLTHPQETVALMARAMGCRRE